MKIKSILSSYCEEDILEGEEHPEVKDLMARLTDIDPKDLAQALYHIESFRDFPQIFSHVSGADHEQSQLYFSRGLKSEMESIYLALAKHLKAKSNGSTELMNAVFDFLGKTLVSLFEVPHLISMN